MEQIFEGMEMKEKKLRYQEEELIRAQLQLQRAEERLNQRERGLEVRAYELLRWELSIALPPQQASPTISVPDNNKRPKHFKKYSILKILKKKQK